MTGISEKNKSIREFQNSIVNAKNVQFYEITSAIKGYGRKMVNAVFESLSADWTGVVVMDWSGGFWNKMEEEYHNLEII